MEILFFLLCYLGGLIYASVVAVQKGRVSMMVLGWLIFAPLIVIAACRIAKPGSSYARKHYAHDPLKDATSHARFPKESYALKQAEVLSAQLTAAGVTHIPVH